MKKFLIITVWALLSLYVIFPFLVFALSFMGMGLTDNFTIIMLGFGMTIFVFFIPWIVKRN